MWWTTLFVVNCLQLLEAVRVAELEGCGAKANDNVEDESYVSRI